MPDRPTPFKLADERDTLVEFLDYLRDGVVQKLRGLGDDAVTRQMVPSGTSLLGLVKHLTWVEEYWFTDVVQGLDVPLPCRDLELGDGTDSVVTAYRAACARTNLVIGAQDDLDALCARNGVAPEPMSLRWVLVHLVEGTGRHAGHADIIRELLDGETGR